MHLLISTYIKTQTARLKSFLYRDYKRWNNILLELESKNLPQNSISSNENYEYLSYQFADVVNKHASLKTKVLLGKNAPFFNKQFRNVIYRSSLLRNKFNRKPNKLNWEKYKKQWNKCVKLRKSSIKLPLKILLRDCSYENNFPVAFPLNREKTLFPCVHIRNISPPGRDLFWRAVRWENFERSQYSKWVT